MNFPLPRCSAPVAIAFLAVRVREMWYGRSRAPASMMIVQAGCLLEVIVLSETRRDRSHINFRGTKKESAILLTVTFRVPREKKIKAKVRKSGVIDFVSW